MRVAGGVWVGLLFGAGYLVLSVVVPSLSELFSPGVPTWWAFLALLGTGWAGLICTGERHGQRGIWRASPLLTAIPLTLLVWAAREPLTEVAGVTTAVLLALLGMRGLAEVGIATAVVGAFFAPDATILNWYAGPVLAGLLATAMLLHPLATGLHGAARRAAGRRVVRRARLLALLSLPIALLQRGAERAVTVSFIGTVYAMTRAPKRSLRWKRWAVRLNRRRGLLAGQIDALHDLAVNLGSAGRHADGLVVIAEAGRLAGEDYPRYLARMNPEAKGWTRQLLELRSGYQQLNLALVEGRLRRDLGDLDGALKVAETGLAAIEGPGGLAGRGRSLAETMSALARYLPEDDQTLARRLLARLHGEHADYLSFRALVVGTLLHDDAQALTLLGRALRVAKQAGDPARELMYTINHATLLARLRRYGDARQWLHRALALVDSADLPRYGDGAEGGWIAPQTYFRLMALGMLGNVDRLQGRLDSAERYYQQALALATDSPAGVGLNARLGLAMLHLARGEVAAARREADIALRAADDVNSDAFLRAAYLVAGRAYERDDPATAYRHYRRAVEQVERSRASLDREDDRLQFLGGEPRVEAYERMAATCVGLDRPADAFEYAERGKARALAERLGGDPGGDGGPLSWRAAQALLGDTLLVQYFSTAEVVLVIGLRAGWDRPRAVTVPADRDALRRFALTNFGSAGRVRELVRGGLEELWHGHDPLIAPVLTWSRPDDLVVLLPHGLLHYLPLHALRLPDGRYLIERNPVCYSSSASVLAACRSVPRTVTGRRAAVFGDPEGDLPHARTEARAVAELVATTPLLGDEVTRAAFTTSVAHADLVHYAGHAAFDVDDPMSSGLRLADGVLTARDIAALPDLRPRLVALSGCETGVSRHHPGDDLLGLVRGFLYAGTPAVLASLWRVPDDSAAHLMRAFYAQPPEVPRAEALRRAVGAVRADDRWRSLHHWAPFILVGDWA